jgi:NAD(P)-dependent dehydrogenase (short-subunit alcohol dehydrogenase family)
VTASTKEHPVKQTIAIAGAGPGLGLSIAKRFGAHDYRVALLARDSSRLDSLVQELAAAGVTARGYQADLLDRVGLTATLNAVESDLGGIDVLEFSPVPQTAPVAPDEVTPEIVAPGFEQQVLGAISAVQAVLPGMKARGHGALLFVNGSSAINPFPPLANLAIAAAGLRNYARNLSATLGPQGIYVGHLVIDLMIAKGEGEADPDSIAARLYDLLAQRDQFEIKIGDFSESAFGAI